MGRRRICDGGNVAWVRFPPSSRGLELPLCLPPAACDVLGCAREGLICRLFARAGDRTRTGDPLFTRRDDARTAERVGPVLTDVFGHHRQFLSVVVARRFRWFRATVARYRGAFRQDQRLARAALIRWARTADPFGGLTARLELVRGGTVT